MLIIWNFKMYFQFIPILELLFLIYSFADTPNILRGNIVCRCNCQYKGSNLFFIINDSTFSINKNNKKNGFYWISASDVIYRGALRYHQTNYVVMLVNNEAVCFFSLFKLSAKGVMFRTTFTIHIYNCKWWMKWMHKNNVVVKHVDIVAGWVTRKSLQVYTCNLLSMNSHFISFFFCFHSWAYDWYVCNKYHLANKSISTKRKKTIWKRSTLNFRNHIKTFTRWLVYRNRFCFSLLFSAQNLWRVTNQVNSSPLVVMQVTIA